MPISKRLVGLAAAFVLVAGGSHLAAAAPIGPGFDGFETPASVGSSVDLTSLGLGVIPLEGVPLGSLPVDTIVARLDSGPPHNDDGVIDIELVALHLKSVAPIPDINPLPGPLNVLPADLHVTIDRSANFWTAGLPFPDGTGTGPSLFPSLPFNTLIPRSIGLMNIHHPLNLHNGGTFEACFGSVAQSTALGEPGLGQAGGGIFADAFFTLPGQGPDNALAVLFHQPAPQINLSSSGNWLHVPIGGQFPSGNFVVNTIAHTGPHPPDPATIPEPSTAALLGFGLLGLLAGTRRLAARRRAA